MRLKVTNLGAIGDDIYCDNDPFWVLFSINTKYPSQRLVNQLSFFDISATTRQCFHLKQPFYLALCFLKACGGWGNFCALTAEDLFAQVHWER